jgi:hypothetical protein
MFDRLGICAATPPRQWVKCASADAALRITGSGSIVSEAELLSWKLTAATDHPTPPHPEGYSL